MTAQLILSNSQREMLKAIHRATVDDRSGARNGDLAEVLGVSPGTITATLKALSKKGLIEHNRYKGNVLTENGLVVATACIRRHRIVERFLHDKLGYSGEEADVIAPSFEHSLADEVEQRMYEVLGMPKTCPHGYAIPSDIGVDLPAMESLYEISTTTTGMERTA